MQRDDSITAPKRATTRASKPRLIRDDTQEARVLALLESHALNWTSAEELSALSLQYCARISCLRRRGIAIENRLEMRDGRRRGFYRLVPQETQRTLFPRSEISGRWRDPEEK